MTLPPDWLSDLADRAAMLLHSPDVLAPVGCHYFYDPHRDVWEATLFVSRTETVGGELDGQILPSRFGMNIKPLSDEFDDVEHLTWQATKLGDRDELGPHISIEGKVGEETLWLRILAEPPEGIEPGRVADTITGEFDDRW